MYSNIAYHRMCSLAIECVLLLWNVSSHRVGRPALSMYSNIAYHYKWGKRQLPRTVDFRRRSQVVRQREGGGEGGREGEKKGNMVMRYVEMIQAGYF